MLISRKFLLPSSQKKEEIEEKLTSFLLTIQNNPNINVTCGEGSWWITIVIERIIVKAGNWVIPEFMSWVANKCFDKVEENIINKRTVSPSPSNPIENSLNNQIQQNKIPESASEISEDTIRQCMYLRDSLGINQFNVVEWSESQSLGRSISITETQDGTDVTLIQTDS